jgi:hypothetical protein
MRRTAISFTTITSTALTLGACGLADSRTPLPDFLRAKPADPPPPEQPPDVRRMVREKLDSVFVAQSNPQKVQVSEPHHELRGLGWSACVKAELTSATGKPLGQETYLISINGGVITDRRRALTKDNCDTEAYQPI